MDPDSRSRPTVVMIVGNVVTPDTRVKKMAATVARAGFEVTLLGLSKSKVPWTTRMGDIEIRRLVLETTYRAAARVDHESTWAVRRARSKVARLEPRDARLHAELALQNREFQAAAVTSKERLAASSQAHKRQLAERLAQGTNLITRVMASQSMRLRRWAAAVPIRVEQSLRSKRIRRLRERRERAATSLEWAHQRRDSSLTVARARPQKGSDWRSLLPDLHDFEMAYGTLIDELRPDIIHAHDIAMIGIAARAAARLRGQGHPVRWIYDSHEYVRGLDTHMSAHRWRGYVDLQDEYIGQADAVITVSESLADRLQVDHGLLTRPCVVLNAPMFNADPTPGTGPTVRARIGLTEDVPLLVYSGWTDASRGAETMVEALEFMPEVHVALVCGETPYVQSLRDTAIRIGAGDRFHTLGYVSPEHVVHHLSTASVGVNLLTHCVNHEVALPNKFFEYLHAGLPILNADVGISAQLVRERDIGRTFEPRDARSLAAEAVALLADRERHAEIVRKDADFHDAMSWQQQERNVYATYAALLGTPVSAPRPPGDLTLDIVEVDPRPTVPLDTPRRLLIGPSNWAGQATAWAGAARRAYDGLYVETHTVLYQAAKMSFQTDVAIPQAAWRDPAWQRGQLERILASFTHVLFEGGRPLAGGLIGASFTAELSLLHRAGIKTGVVFHGSDIRSPERHRELVAFSPFGSDPLSRTLQQKVDRLSIQLAGYEGPIFVSTNDLLDHVPSGSWLPVVVDLDVWAPPSQAPALHGPRPVVMHSSTNHQLKGAARTLDICHRLDQEGVIELHNPGLVPPDQLPDEMKRVDVYIDGTVLGDYGVTACQAMAMNRLVLGNVSPSVRTRIGRPMPIVQTDPDQLEDLLREIAANPTDFAAQALTGRSYVRDIHDGRQSAAVLQSLLGV